MNNRKSKCSVKRVLNFPHHKRAVFYDKGGIQVAIVDAYATEPEDYLPIQEWFLDITFPIAGPKGWTVPCRTITEAERIANRECSKTGKLINRVWAFYLILLSLRNNKKLLKRASMYYAFTRK